MILLKVAVTISVVTGLSLIAERVSPRVAGILSGYPLGSAIALFFIGVEQGADFAGASAIYTLAGMAAMLFFFLIYYLVSMRVRRAGILIAAAASFGAFLAASAALQAVQPKPIVSIIIAVAALLISGLLFRAIPNTRISGVVRLGPGVMVFRAALAALIILAITGAAGLVPPRWAGLFSAFPSTVFPLILIMHSTYGPEQAHTIIKNLPTGLWSLVLYALAVSAAYPRLGVYWGTLVGYGIATVYLLGLAAVHGRKARLAVAK